MRLLAVLVAWFSFGQCATGLLLLGPHSDLPAQPGPSLAMIAAALGGGWLARALWRRRAEAARGLAPWGAGMGLWFVLLFLVVASAEERRSMAPALAAGLLLWAAAVWLATRLVRGRAGPAA